LLVLVDRLFRIPAGYVLMSEIRPVELHLVGFVKRTPTEAPHQRHEREARSVGATMSRTRRAAGTADSVDPHALPVWGVREEDEGRFARPS
jgi:hypothetical protein